jgi:hypothetical protein
MQDATPKKIKRPGAGRTKGSFSFVSMNLEEINKAFGAMPPTFKLLLSRKQLEGCGFNNLVTGTASELTESIAGQSVETAPKITSMEL